MEFFLTNAEKRAFPRARLGLTCELTLAEGGETIIGQCIDLSTAGARILVNHRLTEGNRVRLRLREHLGKEPFSVCAEIIRVIACKKHTQATPNADAATPCPPKFCVGLKVIGTL